MNTKDLEAFCPKCNRFISLERLLKDYMRIKGLSDNVNPLNRCPHCNGYEFQIYWDEDTR